MPILILLSDLSLCVQGTCSISLPTNSWKRFIPVCTGNIALFISNVRLPSVYPCVYREHVESVISCGWPLGLSLCIQGTCLSNEIGDAYHRFIPVCTGNTTTGNNIPSVKSVYPCVYREHLHKKNSMKQENGLSLCVQGTHEFDDEL